MGVVADVGSLPIWKNKWFWITIAGLIAIYLIYSYGKGKGSGNQVAFKNGLNDIPADWDPNVLADEVYTNTNTSFISDSTQNQTFDKLAFIATDDMLIDVYNIWNTKYQAETGNTMTAQVASIVAIKPDWLGGIGSHRDAAVARLRNANCA